MPKITNILEIILTQISGSNSISLSGIYGIVKIQEISGKIVTIKKITEKFTKFEKTAGKTIGTKKLIEKQLGLRK